VCGDFIHNYGVIDYSANKLTESSLIL